MQFAPIDGTVVVGFGNKARNGKDTAAGIFLDNFGKHARQFSFADALKAIAIVDRGMTEKNPKLLQDIGMEFRAKDPDIWIKAVYYAILEKRPKIALIPDVRFKNEARFVKAMGGVLVRCVRLNMDGTQFIDPSRPADHPSEIELDDYDGWDHEVRASNLAVLSGAVKGIAREVAELAYGN